MDVKIENYNSERKLNSIIKADSLCVGYKNKIVIDGINIEVDKGKIVALIGANGSGKSTFLKTITSQIDSLNGNVIIAGRNVKLYKEKEIAKKMSMVMSDKVHTELMTCRSVIETGRYPYTGTLGILSKEDKEIVEKVLEDFDIKEIADYDFNHISDGQRQRVMLAKAICQQPDILVLDEPTSYLDIKYKLEILKLIKDISTRENIAVIMSLHELELVRIIADTVVCIKDNQVDRIGVPEDILSTEYIRDLFDIKVGGYDAYLGAVCIDKISSAPRCFVIGGSDYKIFERLCHQNIPFAAGILYDNEIAYQVAKNITENVICSRAFYEPDEEIINKALKLIDSCEFVVCADKIEGEYNKANIMLYQYAFEKGKIKEINEII